jgi:3-phenylpropionate/trans-cinnamate dioxygenase ferredoxin reductase subunit
MREHGVDVRLEHEVEKLVGDDAGNVVRIETDHGAIDADCAVIAIGVEPNTEWLAQSADQRAVELDARGGIVVDASLRTTAEDVWAAGDCASVEWFDGTKRPEQLWYTARDQGRVAARALLGDDTRYRRPTWYNSAKLMDVEYTTWSRAPLLHGNARDCRAYATARRSMVSTSAGVAVVRGAVCS